MRTFTIIGMRLSILSLIIINFLNAQIDDTINVNAGWNLISLPLSVTDGYKNFLFPSASSDAFIYQNSYVIKDTLGNGYGFWIKYDVPDTIILHGEPIYENLVNIKIGWNMIGSLTNPISVNKVIDIPDGIIISDFYRYAPDVGYEISDTIKPGFGYWVKVNDNGSIQISNNPPSIPSNPQPVNNSTGNPNNITLNWYCSDPDGDPLTYDIYFGTDNPPINLVSFNQEETHFDTLVISGTSYYWKVIAKDIANNITNGPIWKFTTNYPPTIPSNPNPADISGGRSLNPTLTWSACTDLDGDPINYDVYFGTDNPPTEKISSNQTNTSISRTGLISGTQYFWKISAKDNHNHITDGPVWRFTTMGAPCIGTPTVDYAGKTYNTVQIGDQCWLRENLDVGTMIDSLFNQNDNGMVEKYCYYNNPVNCSTYGGLYQWDEAMQYVTVQGAQGICPSGWHIPTWDQLWALCNAEGVGQNGNKLKAIGQGSGAGTGINTTGFSAMLAGIRNNNWQYFEELNVRTFIWTTTEYINNSSLAQTLQLDCCSSLSTSNAIGKGDGASIRCIKN